MYSTFKMMSNCTNSYYLDKTLEDLVEEYRKLEKQLEDNPKVSVKSEQNKIVAAMFVKVFPMILQIQKKYYSLTNEQKVDHALFHLIRSIKYYKNNNVKFSSFYHTHLTNQMKTLLTCQSNNKNAVFQNIVKDNDLVLNKYSRNKEENKPYEQQERTLVQDIKNSTRLSQEEKEFCLCYLMGYDKMQQICDKIHIKQRLNITDPIKCMNIQDLEKQKKYDLKHVRKIKKSLKEKYAIYKGDIFS